MVNNIHPTAIIEKKSQIGSNVTIGPYCYVGNNVVLQDNVKLVSHISIDGYTTVGSGTEIYPFSSLGHPPQYLKFEGEPSVLIIGKNNRIREHVTMHPGTKDGKMSTTVGDECLFMAGSHVAHDCNIGNKVIFANNATIGGHVEIGDNVLLGGLSGVHQFVRIGRFAIIGGMSGVDSDVIPYGSVKGDRANLIGLNIIGMKRNGIPRNEVDALRNAYKIIFSSEETMIQKVGHAVDKLGNNDRVREIISFIQNSSQRPICLP